MAPQGEQQGVRAVRMEPSDTRVTLTVKASALAKASAPRLELSIDGFLIAALEAMGQEERGVRRHFTYEYGGLLTRGAVHFAFVASGGEERPEGISGLHILYAFLDGVPLAMGEATFERRLLPNSEVLGGYPWRDSLTFSLGDLRQTRDAAFQDARQATRGVSGVGPAEPSTKVA
jgi:hypothetical protein